MSANPTETDGATGEWRELTTVTADAEARLIEGRLENEGIECQLESLMFTQEPVQFGLFGGVRIHVPVSELDRARRLLESLQRESSEALDAEDANPEDGSP